MEVNVWWETYGGKHMEVNLWRETYGSKHMAIYAGKYICT